MEIYAEIIRIAYSLKTTAQKLHLVMIWFTRFNNTENRE